MDIVQKVTDAVSTRKKDEDFKSKIFIIDTSKLSNEELKDLIARAYKEGYKDGLKESQTPPPPAWLTWPAPIPTCYCCDDKY